MCSQFDGLPFASANCCGCRARLRNPGEIIHKAYRPGKDYAEVPLGFFLLRRLFSNSQDRAGSKLLEILAAVFGWHSYNRLTTGDKKPVSNYTSPKFLSHKNLPLI